MKIDKSEKQLKNKKIFKEVEAILKEEFKGRPNTIGLCHKIWARKKRLLKERYNIDWKTPAELNPDITFD